MSKRIIFMSVLTAVCLLLLSWSAGCTSGSEGTASGDGGAKSPGQVLMDDRCSACHSTTRITTSHKTLEEWTSTLQRMVTNGAQLNAEERDILIQFLSETYQ
jgi:hypothetical protein